MRARLAIVADLTDFSDLGRFAPHLALDKCTFLVNRLPVVPKAGLVSIEEAGRGQLGLKVGIRKGRARCLAAFTALLLVSSAVPVLAAEPAPEMGQEVPRPSTPSDEELAWLPDGQDVREGIEEAEAEEAASKKQLESAQAAQERDESRTAFAGLEVGDAQALLQAIFADQLAQLNADPARFLSGAQLLNSPDDTVATVRDNGNGLLMDSDLPVRTENEEGDLRKVDLALEPTAEGFELSNPLTDLILPGSAGGAIEIGDAGMSISQAGVDGDRSAHRFGEMNLFYPGVLTDTDLLVAPIGTGVEVFNQLRSEQSPETLRFPISVPEGATLRANGDWGVEVVEGESLLALIPPPTAVDAQGTEVPVDFSLEGNDLVLEVAHKAADLAYPILVDPAINENHENWLYGQNHWALDQGGVWNYNNNGTSWIYGSTHCIYECFGPPSTRGLFVSTPNASYGANQFGQWSYSAPNIHSYVFNVTLGPFNRNDHGCSSTQYQQPHNYFGIWSSDVGWITLQTQPVNGGWYNIPQGGQAAIFGLGTANSGFYIPCWRDLWAGGATLWLDDWARPDLTTSSTDKWIDASPIRLNVSATDIGLGVKSFEATATNSSGGSVTWWTDHSCTGLANARCPSTWNLGDGSQPVLNYNPSVLSEGLQKLLVTAYDVTEKPSYNANEMTLRIDHSAPTITLSGTLTEQATLGTERMRYTVKAEAKDGVPGSAKSEDVRSGATSIVVKNDGQVVSEYSPGCPTQSCSLFRELEVPASELSAGSHTLTVTATDAMGHVGTKQLSYTTGDKQPPALNATGMPSEASTMPQQVNYWSSFFGTVPGGNQLNHPGDVAVDPYGDLWVVDENNNRVQKFNQAGEFLATLGPVDSSSTEQLKRPTSVAIDPKGNIWVAEAGNNRILKFNSKGEFLTKFGLKGTGNGQFAGAGPEGIAIDPKGNIWVSDTYGGRVQKFNENGAFLKLVGTNSSGVGQLGQPAGIDVGPNGDVWVTEWQSNRVSVFNEAGGLVRQFGSSGAGNGQFAHPDAIAVGAKGDVWVGDQGNGRVQEFNQSGAYVTQFGSPGTGKGQFSLSFPMGIATDSNGSLWITDTNNNRVQRWLIPNLTVSGFLEPISASATDGGYGVTSIAVKLTDEAQSTEVLAQTAQTCPQGSCPLSFDLDDVDLAEKPSGLYVLTVAATDASGNVRNISRVLRLDSAPPDIDLSGALAESAGQPLGTASVGLQIAASDFDPASGGVKTINVERDGQLVATYPSNCSSDCHEVEASYAYDPTQDGADRLLQPVSESGDGAAGEFKQVACPALDDCWAVGRTQYTPEELAKGKTPAPLLERWKGNEWQTVAIPKPTGTTDVFLEGITCVTFNTCRASGYYHDGSTNRPLMEIWGASQWTVALPTLPSGVSGAYLQGAACGSTSIATCWAFGRTQVTPSEQAQGKSPVSFFTRSTGTSWQNVPKPAGATDVLLSEMSCSSANACRAAGYYHDGSVNRPLIELWDGTKWSASSLPLPSGASGAYFDGISCKPATNCWAYGKTQLTAAEQAQGKTSTPFFERLNGSEWQVVAAPVPPEALATSITGLSCGSSVKCTAVGRYSNAHSETRPLAYTWDGASWRFQPVPAPPEATNSSLEGISCADPNQCSMVGYSQIDSGKRTVLAEAESPRSEPHQITVEAIDTQGTADSRTIEVDVPEPSVATPKCTPDATSLTPKAVLSPSQAVDELEDALPAAVAPSEETVEETTEVEIDPSFTEPQPNLEAVDSLAEGETSVTPEGGFTLTDIACVTPEHTTSAATDAMVVNQDSAVFANTAPETDTVIRPTAGGTTMVQSLRGPNAPMSFSWTINVASGQELVELPSGAVAIVEDPPEGAEVEGAAEFPAPKGAETPEILKNASLQQENATYELSSAQAETEQEVVAVIAKPWVVLAEGVTVPAKIEVTHDVQIPIKWELEVTLPQSVIEKAVWPADLVVEATASVVVNGSCPRGQSPCGDFDVERATRYALHWGGSRNTDNYHDYGSDDCTNFTSQLLRAGRTKFMRAFDTGDGSWWYFNTGLPSPLPTFRDTESWRLADELPRHLWQYGLADIDHVQQPWGWTRGTVLALDWLGTNGRGDINHLMYVVDAYNFPNRGREPLLANHSTVSYSSKPWFVVKDRIQDAEGGDGWTRFALVVKHTQANLKEKKHAPQNLYGPSGVFDG